MIAALVLNLLLGGAGDNPVHMTKISSFEKALRFEVTVPAPLDDVWHAFATEDGLASWLYPHVRVQLRRGGDWLALYPDGKTGGGTVISFDPLRRLTLKAQAPEQFPTVRAVGTTAVFEFETVAGGTKVTLTQTGWRAGDEWDRAYEYLSQGNVILLQQLHRRFTSGPLSWKEPGGGR